MTSGDPHLLRSRRKTIRNTPQRVVEYAAEVLCPQVPSTTPTYPDNVMVGTVGLRCRGAGGDVQLSCWALDVRGTVAIALRWGGLRGWRGFHTSF